MLAIAFDNRLLTVAIPAFFCGAVAVNQILMSILSAASRRGRWHLNTAVLGAVLGEIVTTVVIILVLAALLTFVSMLLNRSAAVLAIPYRRSVGIIAIAHGPLALWACLCTVGLALAWSGGPGQRDVLALTVAMASPGRVVAEIAAIALACWAVRRELRVSRRRALAIAVLPFVIIHLPDAIAVTQGVLH
jgi:hypothetical protein